jgi:hypothetical protein
MTERNLSMSTETKEVVVVIGPGGIGQAIAPPRRRRPHPAARCPQ